MEAAQAGAAAERAARAAAEAALAAARASLEETHAQLQESLANGPLKALEVLLEEKAAAEGTAAAAIAAEERTASKSENSRWETSRTVGEVRRFVKQASFQHFKIHKTIGGGVYLC